MITSISNNIGIEQVSFKDYQTEKLTILNGIADALDDTFHSAKVRENSDIPSWNAWKPVRHSEEPENIDHLFISRNTTALSWKLNIDSKDGLYPSDHFPIVVVWDY